MDWAQAIAINQKALIRIVAMLFAMAGLERGGAVESLSRPVYDMLVQLLRPAESAVRRLIVIAARGLVLKPRTSRPAPPKRVVSGKGNRQPAFRLFDTRKQFGRVKRKGKLSGFGPRIHGFWSGPLVPLFQPAFQPAVQSVEDGIVSAVRLCRRLHAIKLALEDLPHQARRLVRWQQRRNSMQNPRFKTPLRPCRPPGFRKEPRNEVEAVLTECHGLALDVLSEDTS